MTKRCYVTSDMHMAAGPGTTLEDFVDDDAFAAWLDTLIDDDNGGAGDTTLVLNGDIVDFALIDNWRPADYLPSYLLWTEDDSVDKIKKAIAGHYEFFEALARFHIRGGTIWIIVGNHDLDWIWPGVQDVVAKRLGAAPLGNDEFDRLVFEPLGRAFANVYVEHGHRFTGENAPNNPDDPDSWIHEYEHDGETKFYLERVWGTDFLVSFFNDKHESYPWAANIKPTLALVTQGLKNGWFGLRDMVRVLGFLARRKIPAGALIDFALPGEQEIEIEAIAERFGDADFGGAAFGDVIRAAAEREGIDVLTIDPDDPLLDAELIANLLTADDRPVEERPNYSAILSPTTDTDDGTLGIFRDNREVRAARELIEQGYDHVVFGHTHHSETGLVIDEGKPAKLWNPGSWVPALDTKEGKLAEIIDDTGFAVGPLNNFEKNPDGSSKYFTKEFNAVEILETDDGPVVSMIPISPTPTA